MFIQKGAVLHMYIKMYYTQFDIADENGTFPL